MLARCSLITQRAFSKDRIASRWRRADPNRYWRAQHNLPTNDEDHGPLADLPDYSYINGESAHMSTLQRKNYEFNASVVRRIHELDSELAQAKAMYAEKIASPMAEYTATANVAKHIQTSSAKTSAPISSKKATPSIAYPHDYSLQPNLLNSLRDATSYNEAYEEAVDPVGAIVPKTLMNIERPPYRRTGDRRRYHKIFTLRTPKLKMFPR